MLLSITPHLLRLYPHGSLIKTIAKRIAIKETSQAYAFETLKGLSKTEIAEIMDAVYRGVKGYQQDVILPVSLLIFYGDDDHTGKVQKYCRQWAERENRPLQVITDAAQNSNMDAPGDFNRTKECPEIVILDDVNKITLK